MNYRLLSLAMVLGTGLQSLPAHAMTQVDYLAERTKHQVTTLQDSDQLATQYAKAGKYIEMDGTVGGIVKGDTYTGYVLQLNNNQSGIIAADLNNQDIVVGNSLRVLAKVPETGTVLQEIAEMPLSLQAANADNPTLAEAVTNAIAPQQQQQPAAVQDDTKPAPAKSTPKATTGKTTKTASATPASQVDSAQVQQYAQKIRAFNGKIDVATATKIAQNVLIKSKAYGVDPKLVFAVLAQESRFNPHAVSPVGARGLGQLMPATARSLGCKNSFDIAQNVDATVKYLSQMIDQFGSTSAALAAYNAGPGNVQRYGGIPPFRETQHYVRTISSHYAQLKASVL